MYQLHGGIIKYGLEEGGEDFEGKCYVFDNRLTVDVNKVNPKVISRCYVCQEPSDRMVNCANPVCNIHVPMCETCGETTWKVPAPIPVKHIRKSGLIMAPVITKKKPTV